MYVLLKLYVIIYTYLEMGQFFFRSPTINAKSIVYNLLVSYFMYVENGNKDEII